MKKKMILGIGIGFGILAFLGVILSLILLPSKDSYEIEEITDYAYYVLYQNEKYGVIDKKGNTVVEPNYNIVQIPNPSKPVFICMKDYNPEKREYDRVVLNEKQEEIMTQYESVEPIVLKEETSNVPYEKSVLKFKQNGKYGLIDYNGKIQIEAIYEDIQGMPYKEGNLKVQKEGKYGVITIRGKRLIKPQYDFIDFDGYYDEQTKYQKAGFIVSKIEDGKLFYGYHNEKGKMILDTQYEEIKRIIDDKTYFFMVWQNGKVGIYQGKKKIVEPIYDELTYDEASGVYIAEKGRKYGILGAKGKEILPVEQDNLTLEGEEFVVQKGEEEIRYNSKGEKIEEKDFSKWKTANDQYKIIKDKQGRCGIQNEKGEILVPTRYASLEYFENEFFIASNEEGKVGVINDKGSAVVEPIYDAIGRMEKSNFLKAIKENQFDIYNSDMKQIGTFQGEELKVEEVHNYFRMYTNAKNVAYYTKEGQRATISQVYPTAKLFAKEENGKWGYVDSYGNVIVDYQYDHITEFGECGFAGIKKDGKWGVLFEDGSIIKAPCYELEEDFPEFIGPYYKVLDSSQPYYTDWIEEKGE